MRSGLLMGTCLVGLALSGSGALAGPAYEPILLAPPETIEPPQDMLLDVAVLLEAAEAQDWEGLAEGIADQVRWVDAALEMGIERHVEMLGPWPSAEEKLEALAYATGGDVMMPSGPEDETPHALIATAENIVATLRDEYLLWARDPAQPDAICTYGWLDYDRVALAALAQQLDIFSSAFFYLEAPQQAFAAADTTSAAVALEPNRLYAIDYDADTPRRWIGIFLPDGGTGYLDYYDIEMMKPYHNGLCFAETAQGWKLVGQTSTSL